MTLKKFNNTGAQNIRSIYHMKIILKYVFIVQSLDYARYIHHCFGRHFVALPIYVNQWKVYKYLMHGDIPLPEVTSYGPFHKKTCLRGLQITKAETSLSIRAACYS